MTNATQEVERRKNRRVLLDGRADAVLFGLDFTKGVQIVDVSSSGLAFRYVDGQKMIDGPLELDILWDHMDVFLLNLKMEAISDFQLANEFLLGVIPIRRCGVEFVNLTVDQLSQLENLMGKSETLEA
ncbi:MAG: PilZ domain-containing protein [Deltaproteobacteria bacterium]|nr:PilZ domain-containing protein [Deltaproteobacteria bacterium]